MTSISAGNALHPELQKRIAEIQANPVLTETQQQEAISEAKEDLR